MIKRHKKMILMLLGIVALFVTLFLRDSLRITENMVDFLRGFGFTLIIYVMITQFARPRVTPR